MLGAEPRTLGQTVVLTLRPLETWVTLTSSTVLAYPTPTTHLSCAIEETLGNLAIISGPLSVTVTLVKSGVALAMPRA